MSKALVTFFSASGVTAKLADRLAGEACDFTGKTVVPFATSGSSPIGDSGRNMQTLASGATVVEGRRFSNSISVAELKSWAAQWV